MRTIPLLLAILVSLLTPSAIADTIKCVPSADPSAGGYCSFIHQSRPESWVRGSATLDTSTGVLNHGSPVGDKFKDSRSLREAHGGAPRRSRQ
jgi:hypothetical protein